MRTPGGWMGVGAASKERSASAAPLRLRLRLGGSAWNAAARRRSSRERVARCASAARPASGCGAEAPRRLKACPTLGLAEGGSFDHLGASDFSVEHEKAEEAED